VRRKNLADDVVQVLDRQSGEVHLGQGAVQPQIGLLVDLKVNIGGFECDGFPQEFINVKHGIGSSADEPMKA
jgi:hypothetical protein